MRALWEQGLPVKVVAARSGITVDALNHLAIRQEFTRREPNFWRPDEDAILRRAFADGRDDRQVAALISSRTVNGVAHRRKTLGIEFCGEALANVQSRGVVERNVFRARDKSDPQPPQIVHSVFPRDLHCEAVDYTPQHNGCRWMISGARPWTVCASDRMDGSSYCVAHQKRSMKHPELMEQAA